MANMQFINPSMERTEMAAFGSRFASKFFCSSFVGFSHRIDGSSVQSGGGQLIIVSLLNESSMQTLGSPLLHCNRAPSPHSAEREFKNK